MKHKFIAIAVAFSLGCIAVSNAREVRSLSLEEAVSLSLQHSKELKISGSKVRYASAVAKEARQRRLPDLKASGSYLRVFQPDIDLKVKTGNENNNSSNQGDAASSSFPEVNQAVYGMVNASVPLFSGFRIQYGIRSARYLERAAELDAEKDRQDIIQNTVEAYCNLYKSRSALELVKENLKQAEQRVKDFSNLEKNGVIARNDLLKVQLQSSDIELALLEAQNNYELSSINMDLMLGLPEDVLLDPDSSSISFNAEAGNFETWQGIALHNRQDAAASHYRGMAASSAVKAARGEYLPSLALTGGYIAADIPGVLIITNAVNAGIGLSYSPSSLWKTGAKVAQAKAQLEQAEIGESLLGDAIRLQVAKAYQDYISAVKKLDIYEKAVLQADENYRIVKNKYDNALENTTDLLDADVAQLRARINQANGKADAMVAYNRLLQAAGTINTGQ